MKHTFALSIILVASTCLAQYTLTSANSTPVIGDAYTEFNADTAGVEPGKAGMNEVWNFSNLNILSSGINNLYVDPAITPYYNSYYSASTVALYNGSGYTYYQASSDSLTSIGFIGLGGIPKAIYSPTKKVNTYPFSYSDSFTDSYSLSTGGYGVFASNADANGTLILPNAIFTNTLRVVNSDVSSRSGGLGTLLTNYLYTYKWYNNSSKFSLLTINITIDSTFHYGSVFYKSGTKSKSVRVSSITTGTNDLNSENPFFGIYPSPATSVINIVSPNLNDKARVNILNAVGQQVFSSEKNNNVQGVNEIQINISNLPAGIYSVSLDVSGKISTQKFIKIQ